MRDVGRLPRRVVGRDALERRLRGVLIQAGRFAHHRARSAADRQWACRVVDSLQVLLSPEPILPGSPRSVWEGDDDERSPA